jgi:hypothetical protein
MSARFPVTGSLEAVAVRAEGQQQGQQQAIPTDAEIELEWVIAPYPNGYDLEGFFDEAEPTLLSPPVPGIYGVSLRTSWEETGESSGVGERQVTVKVGPGAGAVLLEQLDTANPAFGTPTVRNLSAAGYADPNRPFKVIAFQDSGASDDPTCEVVFTASLYGTAPKPED